MEVQAKWVTILRNPYCWVIGLLADLTRKKVL